MGGRSSRGIYLKQRDDKENSALKELPSPKGTKDQFKLRAPMDFPLGSCPVQEALVNKDWGRATFYARHRGQKGVSKEKDPLQHPSPSPRETGGSKSLVESTGLTTPAVDRETLFPPPKRKPNIAQRNSNFRLIMTQGFSVARIE